MAKHIFNAAKIAERANVLWTAGYDGWDSAEVLPTLGEAFIGRKLSTDESEAFVRHFRRMIYGRDDMTLRRVKGAKLTARQRYAALGDAKGLAKVLHEALDAAIRGAEVEPTEAPVTPEKATVSASK